MADGEDDHDVVRDHYDVANPWSGVSVLLSYVVRNLEEEVDAARDVADDAAASFHRRSLEILEAMRADLAEDPRPADEVLRYLERAARRYVNDPGT